MLADKDHQGALARIAPAIDAWFVGAVDYYRSEQPQVLAAEVAGVAAGVEVRAFETVEAAYCAALDVAGESDRIVIFGSCYTVGAVLSLEDVRAP